jgi:light-regulated signal transduction histidine kinase (bacteriophytochrome)
MSAVPFRSAENQIIGALCLVSDIDKERRAADALIRGAAELRVSNQALVRANEDLNQFAFAASHDLQEPLRMITSYSQLLVKGYSGQLDGEAATCIGFITQGTKRMRELLADLLAYTQLTGDEEEEPVPVELNDAFQTAVENCRTAIDETGASVTSGPLPAVLGHKPHFVQLFQNLISNGLKYRSDRVPHIHVSAELQDDVWRISVRDNGIGIDPEYHEQIFGVFKRLHGKSIPGTGIGLAICKRVVDRYDGKIWVESRLDQGATLYFTLSAASKGAAAHD